MTIPPKFRVWSALLHRLNDLRAFVIRSRIIAGLDYDLDESSPDGTRLVLHPSSSSSSSSSIHNDFSCYDAGAGKLGIDNGTVMGGLPIGMVDGAARGSEDAYTISVAPTDHFVYLVVFVDTVSGAILNLSINVGPIVPPNEPDTGYRALADFNYDEDPGVITVGSGRQGVGNQQYDFCSGTHVFWT